MLHAHRVEMKILTNEGNGCRHHAQLHQHIHKRCNCALFLGHTRGLCCFIHPYVDDIFLVRCCCGNNSIYAAASMSLFHVRIVLDAVRDNSQQSSGQDLVPHDAERQELGQSLNRTRRLHHGHCPLLPLCGFLHTRLVLATYSQGFLLKNRE